MSCKACGDIEPGKFIPVNDRYECCSCGNIVSPNPPDKWDKYFHSICETVAANSSCLSRKIGAILVRDKSIISTGYNSPARGIPHCGAERFAKDPTLNHIPLLDETKELYGDTDINTICPRKLLGYESGKGMEYCTAQHAEENCVSNAARFGTSTVNSILYMNCIIPCKNCFSTLINAGIKEIVIESEDYYDNHTEFIAQNSNIIIREFNL